MRCHRRRKNFFEENSWWPSIHHWWYLQGIQRRLESQRFSFKVWRCNTNYHINESKRRSLHWWFHTPLVVPHFYSLRRLRCNNFQSNKRISLSLSIKLECHPMQQGSRADFRWWIPFIDSLGTLQYKQQWIISHEAKSVLYW
jgi:hypothetical protein